VFVLIIIKKKENYWPVPSFFLLQIVKKDRLVQGESKPDHPGLSARSPDPSLGSPSSADWHLRLVVHA